MKPSGSYLIVECSNCSHRYTYYENDVDPAQIYSDDLYRVVDTRGSIFDKIMSHEYLNVLRNVRVMSPRNSLLLDFGCGKGKFLSLAAEMGFNVKGVEPALERAEYARRIYGLDVSSSYYEKGKIGNRRFDVITLLHVLEHLSTPRELVANLLCDNLAENGFVVVEVPNYASLQSKLSGSTWIHLDVPRHYSHFTPERLETFLQDVGLQVVKKEFFSSHLGVVGYAQMCATMFGYRRNVLEGLKKGNRLLFVGLAVVAPLCLVLELLSSAFNAGGIIRVYCRRKNSF